MFTLVWIERPMGMTLIRKKTFTDRAERFKYILKLEQTKYFDRVVEMRGE